MALRMPLTGGVVVPCMLYKSGYYLLVFIRVAVLLLEEVLQYCNTIAIPVPCMLFKISVDNAIPVSPTCSDKCVVVVVVAATASNPRKRCVKIYVFKYNENK